MPSEDIEVEEESLLFPYAALAIRVTFRQIWNRCPHLLAVLARRQSGVKVQSARQWAHRRRGSAGRARPTEPLHAPLPLARGLVRVFGTVVEIARLAMFHTWEHLPLGCAIAVGLIYDDDARDVRQSFQQLAEEFFRRFLVMPALYQESEHAAVLIDRPPQIVVLLVDRATSRPSTTCRQGLGRW